jgi:hypothetical protein
VCEVAAHGAHQVPVVRQLTLRLLQGGRACNSSSSTYQGWMIRWSLPSCCALAR